EFLAEVQQMEKKNLALEALRKLINDGIRSRSKANVVQTKAFSERLEDAVARYHANAINTAEVLQELIELAKDIRAAHQRGEESGLSDEEYAFYMALAENNSAVEVMGNDQLMVIAHELLVSLRENVTVDWAHRESARARMRVLVKRILRKYGYPPDLQDAAVQTVLRQAEALSAAWADCREAVPGWTAGRAGRTGGHRRKPGVGPMARPAHQRRSCRDPLPALPRPPSSAAQRRGGAGHRRRNRNLHCGDLAAPAVRIGLPLRSPAGHAR